MILNLEGARDENNEAVAGRGLGIDGDDGVDDLLEGNGLKE